MNKTFNKYQVIVICAILVVSTLVVYLQVLYSDFTNFDDEIYVSENQHVNTGLTLEGISWAFTSKDVSYWHPLTWLSHMLDCELFGLKPGMHHLTNLILHMANGLLLFWVFNRMTGSPWRSAFVAFVFALHPLNVDSVAWVSERKNILSTLFWLLTMLSYTSYVHRGGVRRYILTLFFFTLGLLAKPMLVTLPFVMLLLDYWPLGRFQPEKPDNDSAAKTNKRVIRSHQASPFFRLIVEKAPFFVLAGVSIFLFSS